MIALVDTEIEELLARYKAFVVDESENMELNWVTRKFLSTNNVVRLVEKDGMAIIKKKIDYT